MPLDALKIKRQVNPEAFRGRGVLRIFLEEGTTLYRGWGWTMARNAPGSFAVCQSQCRSTRLDLFLCTHLVLAFRRLCCDEGLCTWYLGLLQGHLDTELHCFHSRCRGFHHHRCPIRCHQDPYTKRKLRAQGQRCHCHERPPQTRGPFGSIQRPHS